ncbi:MAG: histidine--tRNA ligase, partial [Oscillospiraceae bacterium]|nr:histidine--tRNA ligase [Oscillospiraceae bacterium]
DIRLIDFMISFFAELGLKNLNLEINSIGCHDCRGEYYKALAGYMRENSDELCPTCIVRLEKNPMRILDCKNPACIQISEKAPMIIGYLCGECESHFNEVKSGLDILKIKYSVNPKIVRGLDYYTRTVFEFVTDEIGAQGTVCGGGRYDDLIENLGGAAVSGLGFALGVERLMILMEKLDTLFEPEEPCMLYICNAGEKSRQKTLEIASALNRIGKRCECDETGRGLKAQMKFADKLGAKYTAVIGDEELETDTAKVKNMQTGETIAMSLNDIKKGKMK